MVFQIICRLRFTMILSFAAFIFVSGLISVSAKKPAACTQPMDEGHIGKFVGIRLYYDTTTDRCKPFAYKGAGGTLNRFLTDKQCMKNCSALAQTLYPDDERVCQLDRDVGNCKGHYLLWHFNSKLKECETFLYSGCGGNGNRFFTKAICNVKCNPPKAATIKQAKELKEDEKEGMDVGLVLAITVGCIAAVILVTALTVFLMQKKKTLKRSLMRRKVPEEPAGDGFEMR